MTYAGKLVGGPQDGRYIESDTKELLFSNLNINTMKCLNETEELGPAITYYTYRWNPLYKIWEFFDDNRI